MARSVVAGPSILTEICGLSSMRLTTDGYGLEPTYTRTLLSATSRDTLRTRESAGSQVPVPGPQQGLLVQDVMAAAHEHKAAE